MIRKAIIVALTLGTVLAAWVNIRSFFRVDIYCLKVGSQHAIIIDL